MPRRLDGVMTPAEAAQFEAAREVLLAKRRAMTTCRYGHELVWQRNGKKRYCPVCKSDRQYLYRVQARIAKELAER